MNLGEIAYWTTRLTEGETVLYLFLVDRYNKSNNKMTVEVWYWTTLAGYWIFLTLSESLDMIFCVNAS